MTSDSLVAFLNARLDEDEAAAKRMLDGAEPYVWPWGVWVVPGIRGRVGEWEIQPSIGIAEHAPKRYRRIWDQAESEYPHVDDGWVVHDSAICVWSEGEAKRRLREVEAKRAILTYEDRNGLPGIDAWGVWRDMLKHLASAWSDHPDYDPSWNL